MESLKRNVVGLRSYDLILSDFSHTCSARVICDFLDLEVNTYIQIHKTDQLLVGLGGRVVILEF